MTAATDFRLMRLSRETRDWLAAGAALAHTLASDYESEGIDPEPILQLAYACETVVDEWDAVGEGKAT